MRVAALVCLLLLIAAATVILVRSPWSYADQDRIQAGSGATRTHPAGTDDLGRDTLDRLASALLLGLAGSTAASALATALSLCLGFLAAFSGGWTGCLILYTGDLLLTLPWIFLLMMLRAALPLNLSPLPSATLTFTLLAALGVPAFLRFHYTRALALSRSDWLLQSHAAGLRGVQIFRGYLPHLRPLILAQFLLYVPACIAAEANLGTLGLGIGEPVASWGSMLQTLQSTILTDASRLMYLPLALLILVLALLEILADRKSEVRF